MGGKAFPTYSVPRLPTDTYERILPNIQKLLLTYYERAGSPLPQPDKEDHGDLDFVVIRPNLGLQNTYEIRKDICALLGAIESTEIGPVTSFLMPLGPDDIADIRKAGMYLPDEKHYGQVDIHMTSSMEQCEWVTCIHSYGDLFSLFGTMMKPFGLTYTDKGVYIRIAEMEAVGAGKRARIFVTGSSRRFWEEILNFPQYEHFFHYEWTLPEMYAFATECRFFQFSSFIKDQALDSNARRRMKGRRAFREFVEAYLPKLREEQPKFREKGKELTREMIWNETMERFEGVKEIAEEKLQSWRAEISAQNIRREARKSKKNLAKEQQTYQDAWIRWLNDGEIRTQ